MVDRREQKYFGNIEVWVGILNSTITIQERERGWSVCDGYREWWAIISVRVSPSVRSSLARTCAVSVSPTTQSDGQSLLSQVRESKEIRQWACSPVKPTPVSDCPSVTSNHSNISTQLTQVARQHSILDLIEIQRQNAPTFKLLST